MNFGLKPSYLVKSNILYNIHQAMTPELYQVYCIIVVASVVKHYVTIDGTAYTRKICSPALPMASRLVQTDVSFLTPRRRILHTCRTPKSIVHRQFVNNPPAASIPYVEHSDGEWDSDELAEEDSTENKPKEMTLPPVKIRPCTTQRKKRSEIWRHGNHVEKWIQDQKSREGRWVERWQCQHCSIQLYDPSSTTHILDHLERKHAVTGLGNRAHRVQRQIDNSIRINIAKMKRCLIRWIASDHVSFIQIESEAFRDLLAVFSAQAIEVIPDTGDTIRAWTISLFKEKKAQLGELLSTSSFKVHVSFDGWTAGNTLGLVGIVAHWCTENGLFQRALLGLREIDGRHTGVNIAICIDGVLKEYGISSNQVGYYVLDNASNNDSAVENLSVEYQRKRLRCAGHILNLVVNVLYSVDSSKGNKAPALQRVRNLINYINNSPYQKREFGKICRLKLQSDNKTRWGSTDNMLKSVLDNKFAFDKFVRDITRDLDNTSTVRNAVESSLLTSEDYAELEELHKILHKFRDLQIKLQGICLVFI